MTAYFDEIRREIRDLPSDLSRASWLEAVAFIEERVIRDVTLVTGDREFPDDLRERILGAIATQTVSRHAGLDPVPRAVDMTYTLRESWLCETLHSLFHVLAGRRIRTRFGLMQDSPRGILILRDEYEKSHTDRTNRAHS